VLRAAQGRHLKLPEPGGEHGTQSKIETNEVRTYRRDGSCDGIDHPADHGGPRLGSAERVTDLPPPTFACVLKGTDMGEHMLLFCLLGLVLTATIILVTAPGAVTWALALIE
jgi:hypothetical protein